MGFETKMKEYEITFAINLYFYMWILSIIGLVIILLDFFINYS